MISNSEEKKGHDHYEIVTLENVNYIRQGRLFLVDINIVGTTFHY